MRKYGSSHELETPLLAVIFSALPYDTNTMIESTITFRAALSLVFTIAPITTRFNFPCTIFYFAPHRSHTHMKSIAALHKMWFVRCSDDKRGQTTECCIGLLAAPGDYIEAQVRAVVCGRVSR